MKVYMHEYAPDTTLLFSNEGRVVGVYLDNDDAQSDYDSLSGSDDLPDKKGTNPAPEEMPLNFDDAAYIESPLRFN